MKQIADAPRRGFTLIELLVSIAVIAALAALFFPAHNLIRQKAWDTAALELCSQTAEAWNQVLVSHRRFPEKELILWCVEQDDLDDTEQVAGDLAFPMTQRATSLLNWWKPSHPLPRFDLPNYKKWLDTAAKGKKKIDFSDWNKIEDWPNDLVLERSDEQKKWGLVAPWAGRWIREQETTGTPESVKNIANATVWVMLDINGDGKVSPPKSLGAVAEDAKGDPLVLHRSVIAWVRSGPGDSKLITTW
ncbi:MAG: prepilin-type N-terminal cleavage/methylation domain-containing protein [Kiritimatiellia bacterium]|jgi:prepilin-type N-terminal cleavage/methylation domain-containing protein